MNNKNLDRALLIASVLINNRELNKNSEYSSLYEEYIMGGEVYDLVHSIMKNFGLSIYEYNMALYISAGENNKLFGYSNDELKKIIGVRLNRELYLCYFIIYSVMTSFYKEAGSYSFVEYVRIEDIINSVDTVLKNTSSSLSVIDMDEIEENSLKEISLCWEDMPMVITEEINLRAGRGSKAGIVKLTLNFMISEGLLIENETRYYPKDRFRALMENYFNDNKARLYEILNGGKKDATD
jgi:hypothetical protein